MTIYYYPNPPVQPAPSSTVAATAAADKYFGGQDIYINQSAQTKIGLLGSGLSAGKILASAFDRSKPLLGQTLSANGGDPFPGIASGVIAPTITGTVNNASLTLTPGTAFKGSPVSAYGGTGILSVSISGTLPSGMNWSTSKVNITVTSTAPTISGSGTDWRATFTIASQFGDAPTVGSYYALRGQTKVSYNGIWECTAVTATTIQLKYNANPSTTGGANPPGQGIWSTTDTVTITDAGMKTVPDASSVLYWYNSAEFFIYGTPSAPSPATTYVVTFTDSKGQSTSKSFILAVASGGAPLVSTLNSATVTGVRAIAITTSTPVTASGGQTPYTFSITPATSGAASFSAATGLTFNPSTGSISGIPTSSISSNYVIFVTDNAAASVSQTITVTINEPPALSARVDFPANTFIIGQTMATTFIPVVGVGGTAPLRYSIDRPLPPGLSLDTFNGRITGAATDRAANDTYTITVTSAIPGQSANGLFDLKIDPIPLLANAGTIPTIYTSITVTPFRPVVAVGGYGTVTYAEVTPLPSGLSLNASTGFVSGTPTATTSTLITFSVTDQLTPTPQTATRNFNLVINALPALNTALAQAAYVFNQSDPVSFTPVTYSGGYGTVTYSIFGSSPSDTLPSGMFFLNGLIYGSATSIKGTTNYTITVTDQAGQTSSRTFSITVNAAALVLTIVNASTVLQQFQPITPFVPVIASGGFGVKTFDIFPSPPTGLIFNTSTGQISGTPTVDSLAILYQIDVTDQAPQTQSKFVYIEVLPPPSIVVSVLNPSLTFSYLTAVTSTIPVQGSSGYGTLTYAISTSLPVGLTYNTSTGAITGTPTTTSTQSSYTVTISDFLNRQGTGTFTLSVNFIPIVANKVIPYKLLDQNQSFSPFIPVTASGGHGTKTFSIGSSLPGALTFNTSTGQISGTATVALTTTSFTISINDTVGQITSSSFDLFVKSEPPPPPLVVNVSSASITLTKNVSIAITPITVTGGKTPYTYSLSPGLITPGLNFLAPTGQIAGKPTFTLPTTFYAITVTDAVMQQSTGAFVLSVVNPPLLTSTVNSSTTVLTQGVAFTPFQPVAGSGGFGSITYILSGSLKSGLIFDPATGIISGLATDYTRPSDPLSFAISIEDQADQSTFDFINIEVLPPTLSANRLIASRNFFNGVPITAYIPVQAAGGVAPFVYGIDPDLTSTNGLTFDPATGQISGSPNAVNTTTFTISITDFASSTATNTTTITINAVPALSTTLDISTSTLIRGVTNASISPVSATGGYGTITFSIQPSPPLPTGVTFNTVNGRISGVATQLVNAVYRITATDGRSQTSYKEFNLIVIDPPLVISLTTASAQFTQNRNITPFVSAVASGGRVPYSYSISPALLQPNLTFNTSTALISGKPLTSMLTFDTVTVTVTDADANTSSTQFFYIVNAPSALTNVANNANVYDIYGVPSSFTPVTVTGGDGNLSYTISPSLLSYGLVFNTSTALISGTPNALLSATSVNITVTDEAAQAVTATFTYHIIAPPINITINNGVSSLSRYIQVTPFSPVSATGGFGTLNYSILGANTATLPANLFFDPINGEISGTPTQLYDQNYTITITDGAGQSSSVVVAVNIIDGLPPALNATVVSNPLKLQIGVLDSVTPVSPAGGVAPFRYAISPATPPSGLAYNTGTGVLAGTPSTLGTTNVTITITDNVNQSISRALDIEIISTPVTNERGYHGSRGFSGSQGFTGSRGFSGSIGFTGSIGYTGSIGFTGSQGYTGSEGYVGSQGPLGYSGSRGADGTSVTIVGTTSTSSLLNPSYAGNIGDGYIIESNGNLWIWNSSTWVDVGPVRGPQGLTGFIGSFGYTGSKGIDFKIAKIYNDAPTLLADLAPTGIFPGQLAIVNTGSVEDPENGQIYEWTGSTWVFLADLSGARGETGYSGSRGFSGSQGYTGSLGYTGSQGFVGSRGHVGSFGFSGSLGYTGSIGFTGSIGYTGSQGEIGYTGSQGFTGSDGYVGSRGDLGFSGSQGPLGYSGSRGADGTAVTIVGSTSTSGLLPTPYIPDIIGHGIITQDDGHLWIWDGDIWVDVGVIQGPQGDMGHVGSQGYTGSQSFTGSQGYTGSVGYTGSQGYSGSRGETGYIGSKGVRGESSFTFGSTPPSFPAVGDRWLDTIIGALCVYVDDGNSQQWVEIAASGYLGPPGYAGSQGAGFIGSQGPQGPAGGHTGSQGLIGNSGSEGFIGSQGDRGYSGSRGYGFTGSQGTNAVTVKNEGTVVSNTVTSFNFVGDAVTATIVGADIRVDVNFTVPSSGLRLSGASSGQTTLIAQSVASGNVIVPSVNGTLVTTTASQTLSNKTISAADPTSTVQDVQGNAFLIGFRYLPQSTNNTGAIALSDVGKHFLTNSNITIPLDSSQPFTIGSEITLISNGSTFQVIATPGVTLRLANSVATGTRTIAINGVVKIIKIATNTWILSGFGIS